MINETENKDNNVEQMPNTQAPTPQSADNTSLSLNDIAAVIQIIDLATERGAIRGKDLTFVGNLRDKFSAFIEEAQRRQETPSNKEES